MKTKWEDYSLPELRRIGVNYNSLVKVRSLQYMSKEQIIDELNKHFRHDDKGMIHHINPKASHLTTTSFLLRDVIKDKKDKSLID